MLQLLLDCVLTLDVGSSSARTLVFGFDGKAIPGFGHQVAYRGRVTPDGGWEIDPEALADICEDAVDRACGQFRAAGIRPAAVAFATFWQHILGVGEKGTPVTPILHVFDTRSASQAKKLAAHIDNRAQHQRTGAPFHPSFAPAKLLWLAETRPAAFAAAKRWMTFGEYFFQRIFGRAVTSTCMASGTGLWDQKKNVYDEELLAFLPVTRGQFANPDEMDVSQSALLPAFAKQWPELNGIPWFPALGDGACDNVGSGCVTADRFALMVGTSGAMRAIVLEEPPFLPDGLFCYRLDRKRFVLGGAFSNGGEVFAWCKRTLRLPSDEELEAQLAAMPAGEHGLTLVPLLAGERSPNWRPEARAAITGLGSASTPAEIVRGALESVAVNFREVYEMMAKCAGRPKEIIASGGALLRSPAWVQMMADALNRPVIECLEAEATSRGAALMALERIGAIADFPAGDLSAKLGTVVSPIETNHAAYLRLLSRQRALYTKLFEESW